VHNIIAKIPEIRRKRAQTEFGKADLSVEDRDGEHFPFIQISSPERSDQVSCIKKSDECIPTTTNYLKSLNGQANELTPRRNM
jgi:hypothetical protein